MSFGLNILGAGRQKGGFSLHLYSLSFEPGPISSNATSLPRCLEASGDRHTFELNFKSLINNWMGRGELGPGGIWGRVQGVGSDH